MAAIDKIYGTREQWIELFDFLKYQEPKYLRFLYSPPEVDGPISNFSREADIYLYENCPLEWVRESIHDQYGGDVKGKIEKWKRRIENEED